MTGEKYTLRVIPADHDFIHSNFIPVTPVYFPERGDFQVTWIVLQLYFQRVLRISDRNIIKLEKSD